MSAGECAFCWHPRRDHSDREGCEYAFQNGDMCGCAEFVEEDAHADAS